MLSTESDMQRQRSAEYLRIPLTNVKMFKGTEVQWCAVVCSCKFPISLLHEPDIQVPILMISKQPIYTAYTQKWYRTGPYLAYRAGPQ